MTERRQNIGRKKDRETQRESESRAMNQKETRTSEIEKVMICMGGRNQR